jgi:hypothetical protein
LRYTSKCRKIIARGTSVNPPVQFIWVTAISHIIMAWYSWLRKYYQEAVEEMFAVETVVELKAEE